MAYSVDLFINNSDVHAINKNLSSAGSASCEFKTPIDVENPTIYISAGAGLDKVNYVYIPEFHRYYYCHAVGGTSNTMTFQCNSDPLMSFADSILSSKVIVSRNPWQYDLYVPDHKMPIESRKVKSSFKFPVTDIFDGSHNCYILTTIG